MGADSFIAYYGVRYILADDELEAFETNKDPRTHAAREARLQTYFGRLTDGEPYFVFFGTRLGVFGVEDEYYRAYDSPTLERIMRDTRQKLVQSGLPGEPQLHLQLQARD